MKRILLCFLLTLVAFTSKANIDTLYVKPGDAISFEAMADTVKYPFLKDIDISDYWYHNDEQTPLQLTKLANTYYYNINSASTNDEGFYLYEFDVTLTQSINDTTVYLHVWQSPVIRSYTINDTYEAVINEGDTAHIKVECTNNLDAQEILLLNNNDTILTSNDLEFAFIPTKSGKYDIKVTNPVGSSQTLTVDRTITVIPKLSINSLSCFAYANNQAYVKTVTDSIMDVEIFNHDSVMLIVNTNAKDIVGLGKDVHFVWSKAGNRLPETLETRGDTLVFPEYKKPEMDGNYCCTVFDSKSTHVVSFNVTSEFPLNSEVIETYNMYTSNGSLTLTNIQNKSVIITDILGKVWFNKSNCSYQETVRITPNTLVIIKVDESVSKLIIK